MPTPLLSFLFWRDYLRAQTKPRDWPDVTGVWPIPTWIIDQELWLAEVEAEGRAIAAQYAANQPAPNKAWQA